MTREQLLYILTPLLAQETSATQSSARNVLSTYGTDELHQQFYRAVNAGKLNRDGTPRTTAQAPPVQADRAKAEHQRADAQREQINLEMEQALEWEGYLMRKEKIAASKREAQLRQDREVFLDAAKALRNFAVNEANFNVLVSALGPGNLSVHSIQRAIERNRISLSPPTEDQLLEYQRDDVEKHNEALLNASPTELRHVVRSEAEQRRAQMAQDAVAEADRVHQARDQARGYPLLPNERNGKPLDANYIKRADRTELRFLIQRYGESAVTARLRGQG